MKIYFCLSVLEKIQHVYALILMPDVLKTYRWAVLEKRPNNISQNSAFKHSLTTITTHLLAETEKISLLRVIFELRSSVKGMLQLFN